MLNTHLILMLGVHKVFNKLCTQSIQQITQYTYKYSYTFNTLHYREVTCPYKCTYFPYVTTYA